MVENCYIHIFIYKYIDSLSSCFLFFFVIVQIFIILNNHSQSFLFLFLFLFLKKKENDLYRNREIEIFLSGIILFLSLQICYIFFINMALNTYKKIQKYLGREHYLSVLFPYKKTSNIKERVEC